jgi:leucyl aminopeptidase
MQDIRDIKVRVTGDQPGQVDAEALVINWFREEKGTLPAEWADLDKALDGALAAALQGDDFKGEIYEAEPIRTLGRIKAGRVLLICSGRRERFGVIQARNVAAAATRRLRDRGVQRIAYAFRTPGIPAARAAQAIVDGALTGPLEPDLYRTQDKETRRITDVILVAPGSEARTAFEAGAERGATIARGVAFTRSVADEPANIMTPVEVATRAQAMAKDVGLDCDVLGEDELREQAMLSLLSVATGSQHPARVVVLSYRGDRGSTEVLGLVGKGVTFDTGGVSLKPAENMRFMKYDMCGAAAVLGAMQAIAQLKPKVNVIGVVGLVENMPDGKATKPGDVVRAANGRSIEILNTDAEGRLVLADALDLARRRGATRLVDAATLTGAMVIALGHLTTGAMGAPQGWVDQVLAAAASSGERMWQLPLFPEYKELIESPIADLANTGGRPAGSITAAIFLQAFVADTPWVHLDIAGTAYSEKGNNYSSKGANGAALRTFVELASPSPTEGA